MSTKLTKKTVVTRRVVRRGGHATVSTTSTTTSSELPKQPQDQTRRGDESLSLPPFLVSIPPVVAHFMAGLILLTLFGMFVSVHTVLTFHDKYMIPYIRSQHWTAERQQQEMTYPTFRCDPSDMTTRSVHDLILNTTSQSINAAVDHMLWHGAAVVPNVVPAEKASDLRDFVLECNHRIKGMESIPVIGQKNRWSFALNVMEHASIARVLQEIHGHAFLAGLLAQLLGPNPSLIELSTITAAKGAEAQHYHSDLRMEASAVRYGRSFSAFYTLLIPLQDTSVSMGGTHICPGTHRCSVNSELFCSSEEHGGFSVSQLDSNTSFTDRTWKAGTALLYDAHTRHRGGAHMGGDVRVALILSFVSSRNPVGDSDYVRSLPSGSVYAIRWDHYGFGWNDLKEPAETMTSPNIPLWSLGIAQSAPKDPHGWDFIRSVCFRMQHDDFGYRWMDLVGFRKYRIGVLGKLPELLQGSMDPSSTAPWHLYLVETTENVRVFFGILYGVALVLVVGAIWPLDSSESTERNAGSHLRGAGIILVAAGHLIILWTGRAALQFADASPWGVRQASEPFEYPASPPEDLYLNFSTLEYHDVLLSDRLSIPDIGAYSRFLENHPGNRRWHDELRKAAPLFASYTLHSKLGQPSGFAENLVASVVDRTRTLHGYLFHGQNQYGHWEEFESHQVSALTRNALMMIWLQDRVTASPSGKFYQLGVCRSTVEKTTRLCGQVAATMTDVLGGPRVENSPLSWRSTKYGLPLRPVPYLRNASCFRTTRTHVHNASATSYPEHDIGTSVFGVGNLVDVFENFSQDQQWFAGFVTQVHSRDEYEVELEVDLRYEKRRAAKWAVKKRARELSYMPPPSKRMLLKRQSKPQVRM